VGRGFSLGENREKGENKKGRRRVSTGKRRRREKNGMDVVASKVQRGKERK
jgi:hypothetical protein